MSYRVQTKDGPRAAWRAIQFAPHTFPTIEAAYAFARSLDQDGYYSPLDCTLRVVNACDVRVDEQGNAIKVRS